MFAVFESSEALYHPFSEDFLSLLEIMVTEEPSPTAELHVPDTASTDNTSNLVSSVIALR